MSSIPKDLLYTKEHEWIRKTTKPNVVVVGITDFAQSSLGDITYLDLPQEGRTLKAGEIFGSVESVKSVSELYSPVSGKILKVNKPLADTPEVLNTKPYDDGWMLEIEISSDADLGGLLSPQAYENIAQ
jgi:glycine cleavage system H protein